MFPSCCLTRGKTVVEVMKIMATSFKRSHVCTAHSVPQILQQAAAHLQLHWRLLDTHRKVWVSLLWGHCSFLLGPGVDKVLFVPSKSLFPQSCVSSVIKSHWPPKSNSLRFSVPLLDPQIEKSVVSPRPFLTVFCSLWVICLVAF